jgi:LPXTG-site transpeptidase (sortase) family protein
MGSRYRAKPRHRAEYLRVRRGSLVAPLLGLLLIVTGTAILTTIHRYKQHAVSAAAQLVKPVEAPAPARGPEKACTARPPSKPTKPGVARAVLTIPAIGLTAPVLEGTDGPALDVGVGHLNGSRWPDEGGTEVLEAHNVTFFTHLPSLNRGDLITITSRCRSWTYRVQSGVTVAAGAPVPNLAAPTLVLVTCSPTNALYYTNKRYVVTAPLVRAANAAPTLPPAPVEHAVQASIPNALTARELGPNANGIYLGKLTAHDPYQKYSVGVLGQAEQAEHLLVAARIAAQENRRDWWRVLAPEVPWPSALLLAYGSWTGALDISLDVPHGVLTGGQLTGHLTGRNGTRAITVALNVMQHRLRISSITDQ